MDRLAVGLAVSQGRRLFHGEPFYVFALDLRDPLGSYLTRRLHALGDSRSVAAVWRRAERFDRAPIVTVPTSVERAGLLLLNLEWTPDMEVREGCTSGDVSAVRDFISSRLPPAGLVRVFVAADEERGVFHVAYPARCLPLVESNLVQE